MANIETIVHFQLFINTGRLMLAQSCAEDVADHHLAVKQHAETTIKLCIEAVHIGLTRSTSMVPNAISGL